MANYTKGHATQLSNNFKSTEFDCHGKGCCHQTQIDEKLVTFLQTIRDHFGQPITINSGYRCVTHNKNIGGAQLSQHRYGCAADIVVKDVKPAEVAKYAESIGVLGIGLYETDKDGYFVHIDTRDTKSFWYGQAEAPRSTFDGAVNNKITVYDWQKAAVADGFNFPVYGLDGQWGKECENVAKKAICKDQLIGYKNKNLTRIIQKTVGVKKVDGLFGGATKNAVIKYQTRYGLVADGEVGINTWKKILGV